MTPRTTRWNRTPQQLLEHRISELENQLAQARTTTDLQTVRDLLGRAGVSYREEPTPEGPVIVVDGDGNGDGDGDKTRFAFSAAGRLLRLR